jgi:hypothetical protein
MPAPMMMIDFPATLENYLTRAKANTPALACSSNLLLNDFSNASDHRAQRPSTFHC